MCGILGFISKTDQPNILTEMLEVQKHRGPDDQGIYIDKETGVHLGHNRLSVLDLSKRGHQPFQTTDGQLAIVYNGEIYNFKQIREELQRLGYEFTSSTDTEVVLISYQVWGMACLQKFIGMFAFTILDKPNKKLILVRDRAGVKPLYYYHNATNFLFSSELKSFCCHPSFIKKLNKEVLPHFFQNGYIPAPYCIFENCMKVDPGSYVEYDLTKRTLKTHYYWKVEDHYNNAPPQNSEEGILARLEKILEDAIDLRMVSDVPVGIFLSGGYDSSLVTSVLAKKYGNTLNTFTIGFEDEAFNEANQAREIAEYLGTNHKEFYVKSSDLLELINQFPLVYDEPFGDSSALPTMLLSKLARKDVKVILSADGGDEIFFGYSKYAFLTKYSFLLKNGLLAKILRAAINNIPIKLADIANSLLPRMWRNTNFRYKLNKFVRAINSRNTKEMFLNASSHVDESEVSKILNNSSSSIENAKYFCGKSFSFADNMMVSDYKNFLCDDVLTKVDRATMSVGLEGREPLLDHRIIEFVASVPHELKFKKNKSKYLLRQVLYKNLPPNLVDKPKTGFDVPLDLWLKSDLNFLVEKYFTIEKLSKSIFNVDAVLNLKTQLNQNKEVNIHLVWYILVFQMWAETWLDTNTIG